MRNSLNEPRSYSRTAIICGATLAVILVLVNVLISYLYTNEILSNRKILEIALTSCFSGLIIAFYLKGVIQTIPVLNQDEFIDRINRATSTIGEREVTLGLYF